MEQVPQAAGDTRPSLKRYFQYLLLVGSVLFCAIVLQAVSVYRAGDEVRRLMEQHRDRSEEIIAGSAELSRALLALEKYQQEVEVARLLGKDQRLTLRMNIVASGERLRTVVRHERVDLRLSEATNSAFILYQKHLLDFLAALSAGDEEMKAALSLLDRFSLNLKQMEEDVRKRPGDLPLAANDSAGLTRVSVLVLSCQEQVLRLRILVGDAYRDLDSAALPGPDEAVEGKSGSIGARIATLKNALTMLSAADQNLVRQGKMIENGLMRFQERLANLRSHFFDLHALAGSLEQARQDFDASTVQVKNLLNGLSGETAQQAATSLGRLSRINTLVSFLVLIALFVCCVLVWFIGGRISLGMKGAAGVQHELEKANRELILIRDALEQRVEERTANLIAANDLLQREVFVRNEAENSARQARKAAEDASAAKSRFLGRMSHEIRTPLNGIVGMTELVMGMELPAKGRKFLQMARASADNLLSIVEDLLDFAKLENKEATLRPVRFAVREVLSASMELLRAQAEEKGIAFSCEVDAGVPSNLIGDVGRLRQVLGHLLRNAVESTEQGMVQLSVRNMGDAPGASILLFSVRDTGPGIPLAEQESYFKAFSSSDSSSNRPYVGSGLGLFLTAEIIALMGGKIWLESAPGQGTTVLFSVALSRVPAGMSVMLSDKRAGLPEEQEEGRAECVLVAEDEFVNRSLLETLLEMKGWRVKAVNDGKEAVECIRGGGYPVVLMDIEMPELDGLLATAKIRELERVSGDRRIIIAMTAYDSEEDRVRCRDAGMDEFLPKPIVAEKLYELLNRYLPPGSKKTAQAVRREP